MALRDRLGIWILKTLGDRIRQALGREKVLPVEGRPTGYSANFSAKRYLGIDIKEVPVRSPDIARELIEVQECSRHVRHTLSYAIRDTFSSTDGDDQGWTIAEDLETGKSIDGQVYDLIMDLKDRKSLGDYVIGGDKLYRALKESLANGDSFLSLGFEKDKKGVWGVARSVYLPVWQMFRCEDEQGQLTHYEQRMGMGNESIVIDPVKMVQFSYERHGKYGMSVYQQSLENWADVKDGRMDMSDARRAVGINPNVHKMPIGTDAEYLDAYRDDYELKRQDGVITDIFMQGGQGGGEVSKLSTTNPDLDSLMNSLEKGEREMIPPGFPVWFFPEFNTPGAKDISGQPALAYMRMRNQWCGLIAKGLRQIIDTELVLKLGYDEFVKRGQYRIVFPKWKLNIADGSEDESDLPGITNLDSFRVETPKPSAKKHVYF